MQLTDAMRAALDGQGSIRLEGDDPAPDLRLPDFTRWAGHAAFWPLRNSRGEVLLLFKAIADGVVPILSNPHMTADQALRLRQAYPGFGFREGPSLVFTGEPARIDPRVWLCLKTSGSTGDARLVAATREALEIGVDAIHEAQGLHRVRATGVLLPLSYSYAMANQLLWALRHGKTLVFPPGPLLPADLARWLIQHKVEMLCLVGSQMFGLGQPEMAKAFRLPDVRVVNFAGAPFPAHALPTLRALFPRAAFFNNYGCAEALPRLAVRKVDGDGIAPSDAGKPLPHLSLRIDGPEPGPVLFKGPSTSLGFLQADGSVKEHGEWIASGDVGRIEGGSLHLLGRADGILKIAGERCSGLEIEQAFLAIPGVTHASAFTRAEPNRPEPGLVVCLHGTAVPDSRRIDESLRVALPKRFWPERVFWFDPWPLNGHGKTNRNALCEFLERERPRPLWPAPEQKVP